MSYGVGRRRGSDPTWLWLWHRLAETTLINPPPGEPPNATGVAQKKKKKKKKEGSLVLTLEIFFKKGS